ncbi:MAG TPA: cytochrome C [Thiobacillus sp.]|nr:cytochrome C [Thiobacillus sp.]
MADAQHLAAGRAIYHEGRLPSGRPLTATRGEGSRLVGAAAACVQCHQRSGMGLAEGANVIPPITGPALFGARLPDGYAPRRAPGMDFRDYPFRTRAPYNESTLAQAIRNGHSNDGRRFSILMPRYTLDDAAMKALAVYLRSLSPQRSPGVDERVVHFATVITPRVEPGDREAMIGVLNACFAEHALDQTKGPSGNAESGDRQFWKLHVWTLVGPPQSWHRQLADYHARQPVFAMISGLGGEAWSPVEAFCERAELPCLFPNVQPAADAGAGRYSFYFSRGLWLEAAVFARQLAARDSTLLRSGRVVQLVGRSDRAQRAAEMLTRALADSGVPVETWRLDNDQDRLSGLAANDALVLWLTPTELAGLMQRVPLPPRTESVLVSGILSGMQAAPLNPAWRKVAVLAYGFDAPARWDQRMQRYLRPWLKKYGLARADERLQGNTLAACNLLSEGMLRLRGNYLRDYLVEWVENYPETMGLASAPQAYPRFSLGPGQRFSSKGIYMVRFADADGQRIEPLQDALIVP